MLYEESAKLYKSVQACVLGISEEKCWIFGFFCREIPAPIRYVWLGVRNSERVRSFTKFYLLFYIVGGIIALVLYTYFLNEIPTELRRVMVQIFLPLGFAISAFLAIFSVPSSYITLGIEKSYIEQVSKIIGSMSNGNEHQYDGLKSNIQIFESTVSRKINRMRILSGGLLAYGVYLLWKDEHSTGGVQIIDFIFSDPLILTLCFVVATAIYLSTEAYNKTSDIIFSTIYIGLNEWRY